VNLTGHEARVMTVSVEGRELRFTHCHYIDASRYEEISMLRQDRLSVVKHRIQPSLIAETRLRLLLGSERAYLTELVDITSRDIEHVDTFR
jgi:hypothetical protein